MIYHSRSCVGLLIFLGYAISAAVSACRYLSLFSANFFGDNQVVTTVLYSLYSNRLFYLGKVPLYNFIRLQTFQLVFLIF